MKIKVGKKSILKVLAKVESVIERKNSLPVLASVLLTVNKKGVKMCATNLDCYIAVDMVAKGIETGSMAIPFSSLNKFIKGLREEVCLTEGKNNWLEISDGDATLNLVCMSADEFPMPPELKNTPMIEISERLLTEMIDKTSYAVDIEGGRCLGGIQIEREGKERLRMVATDGHRLSMINKQVSEIAKLGLGKEGVVVPRKGALLLRRLFAVGKKERGGLGLVTDFILLGINNEYLIAKTKEIDFLVRLMGCKFPDYKNAIVREEKNWHWMEINKTALLKTMERMNLVITDQYQGAKITMETDYLEMVSVSPDLGDVREKIKIKYDGEPIEIRFNPKYFIDVLQTMDSDVICLDIKDQTSPCLITGEQDEGFLGLLMPMRV